MYARRARAVGLSERSAPDRRPRHRRRLGHALLAAGGQAINIWTSDEHGARSQRESFEHISAAAHAAIHQHGKAIAHAVGDARQSVNGGRHGIEIARAVVGNDDARHPGFGGNGVVAISGSTDFKSSNFGEVGSTRDAPYDPRQIQFALKLYY